MIKNFKWLFLVAATFVACNSDDDTSTVIEEPLTAGSADFSKYVAIGDSFAAGFSDNALFIEGQKGSYPNLLAQQFAQVGGGAFIQPLMKDNFGGFAGSTTYVPRLFFNGSGPALVPGASTTPLTEILSGGFNNYGVPGAKVIHLGFVGYGSSLGNPYFARMASNPGATVIGDALDQTPTFFSLWIGGNDVLGYATSGGDGSNPITAPATFDAVYNPIIAQLTTGGRKGVVANLPYVTTLPYFTTVPYNPVPLDAATAAQLNGATAYGAYNAGLAQLASLNIITAEEKNRRTITFAAGTKNAVVIMDESLTDLTGINPALVSMRQATAEDLVVLPARNFIGTTVGGNPLLINGVSVPLADKWVLTKTETKEVKDATDAYNITIQAAANANNLAFVDAKTLMDNISTTGISGNGFTIKSTYVTGGAFSLDGIHPSPRGYALIANYFTKAINEKYGSNFKDLDYSKYRIMFPPSL